MTRNFTQTLLSFLLIFSLGFLLNPVELSAQNIDCNGDISGTAYVDSCGNCVEGTTGALPCIDFSPTVSISLSNLECNSLTDFSFSFSQNANEPDVSSAVFS